MRFSLLAFMKINGNALDDKQFDSTEMARDIDSTDI